MTAPVYMQLNSEQEKASPFFFKHLERKCTYLEIDITCTLPHILYESLIDRSIDIAYYWGKGLS